MATRELILRFNSPAFLGDVPAPEPKVLKVIKKGQVKTVEAPHYRIDSSALRVPALRGVLAFWHRAMFAGLTSSQLYERQARILGSASSGQGVSFIPLRAELPAGELSFDTKPDMYRFLYMGYGPLQYVQFPGDRVAVTSFNDTACREALRVESRPWCRLIARGTESQLRELDGVLLLLALFGGIGGRSRRGWGAVEVEGSAVPSLAADTPEALARWYRARVEEVWEGHASPSSTGAPPRHSAFHRDSRLYVTPFRETWQDVMLLFHARFQETRLWRPRPGATATADHALEQADAQSTGALKRAPDRLAFGLPYAPESRSGWRIEYVPSPKGTTPSVNASGRRASPLILKIVRLASGKYAGVALFLGGQFFADSGLEIGALIERKPKKAKPGTAPVPSYRAIQEFLGDPNWHQVPLP